MKTSALKAYINNRVYELEGECGAKYVAPNNFILPLNLSEDEIIKVLDEMTERLERHYLITCPDCCNDVAVIKEIPTGITTYVCDCSVKFELKMQHISLVYKIKKTA